MVEGPSAENEVSIARGWLIYYQCIVKLCIWSSTLSSYLYHAHLDLPQCLVLFCTLGDKIQINIKSLILSGFAEDLIFLQHSYRQQLMQQAMVQQKALVMQSSRYPKRFKHRFTFQVIFLLVNPKYMGLLPRIPNNDAHVSWLTLIMSSHILTYWVSERKEHNSSIPGCQVT